MLDVTKVTHTRAGYPVHNIRRYKGNTTYTILADIEYEGQVESETFTSEGRYSTFKYTGYDLVESREPKVRHQVEEIDVISDFLESLAFSLSVCITELDRIKEEKRD